MKIKPRDYQEKAVRDIRSEFRSHSSVLYVLSTGGGKTVTFGLITHLASQKGSRVIIVVHRKELLLQASKALTHLGIKHGIISPHFTPEPHQIVQVASVDTLLNRLKKRSYQVDLLVVDEAHHVVADNKWGRVYQMLGEPKMLGVTATPVRTDGKGLGRHAGGLFDAMVLGPSITELISRGMLINPTVYTSLEMPDLTGLRKDKTGDYARKELAERVDKPRITGSAVDHYSKICPGAKTVVFCVSIEHAKHVRDEFNAAGYRFELLVGAPHMSDRDRMRINKQLADGEIHGVCTCDLVSEGYDLPDLECCIMLRPTASEGLFLQQVGRIMRPADNKRGCWLFDHVGNVGAWIDGEYKRKHGLPNEEREWTLDGRKKRRRRQEDDGPTIRLTQCTKCYVVHEPAPKCPACGFEYPVTKGRQIEQVDGELQKVTPEIEAKIRARERMEQGRSRTVEELMRLGYSRKRAEIIIRSREEKRALQDELIADLRAWRDETGLSVLDTFGVPISAIRSLKPKALKELRARLDEYRARKMQQIAIGELF